MNRLNNTQTTQLPEIFFQSKRGRPIPFRFGKRALTEYDNFNSDNSSDNNNVISNNKSMNDDEEEDLGWSIAMLNKRARPFR